MTVTESEPAEMPKLQERVEPFIDTAVIEVPAERTPRSESDSRQSSEIVSQDLASVVIPETEPEKAEKQSPCQKSLLLTLKTPKTRRKRR